MSATIELQYGFNAYHMTAKLFHWTISRYVHREWNAVFIAEEVQLYWSECRFFCSKNYDCETYNFTQILNLFKRMIDAFMLASPKIQGITQAPG